MSTDAGSAAAPEDTATRDVASERPGLESADPESADSATSTPETADRGGEGSAQPDAASRSDEPGFEAPDDADSRDAEADTDDARGADAESGDADANPADEGFVASLLRDATITGLPGDTGAPPAEPHAPEAQQQGDEPVGAEPHVDGNPRGVD